MPQPPNLILRLPEALIHSIRHLEIPQETCQATLQFILKALGVISEALGVKMTPTSEIIAVR